MLIMKNKYAKSILLIVVLLFRMDCSVDMASASAGIMFELETNDTYSQANITFDDCDNHGMISTPTDVDWWKVTFSKCGNANFWLGDIPAGCNYNLYLYNSNDITPLASSTNSGNSSELFSYPVLAGVQYYVKIVTTGACSSSYYLFRTKNYPEVTINKTYSLYDQTDPYATKMRYKMNCYGYAVHVYCNNFPDGQGGYRQYPGEFAQDTQVFSDLHDEIFDFLSDIHNTSNYAALNYFQSKIESDFQTMGAGEWTIQTSSATAPTPTGKRKIAIALKRASNRENCDFHFYTRHNDGTWSHKRGSGVRTNKSIDSHVVITDNNISSVISEGNYDDGVRYFLIGKSFIVDYAHGDGQTLDMLYSPKSFKDHAGDVIYKSEQNGAAVYKSCRFDYRGDVDFYEIIPNVSKNYYIMTSQNSSYSTDIILYDHVGNELKKSVGTGNAQVNYYLVAGTRYYVKINEDNNCMTDYVLIVNG